MKAIPHKSIADIRKLLPKHLHDGGGGQGDQMLPDGSRGQHHAGIPEMISTALGSTARPNAETENRQLNVDIVEALSNYKALEPEDQGVSRFVIVWRMYPNKDNPVVKSNGNCGCGCSCGG